MTEYPTKQVALHALAISPQRKGVIFRNAVILRLWGSLENTDLTESEAAYLYSADELVYQAMNALVQTLERVAPKS